MYVRLRYILLASVSLGLLASCSSDEPSAPTSGSVMEFSVGAAAPASRADAPAISEFTVFADRKISESETPSKMMENQQVTYNPATSSWEYEGIQYWFPKHEHSFVAVSPSSVFALGNTPQYSNSKLSFTYTLPADRSLTLDILSATHRRQYDDGAADPVLMRFGHVMTQLNFAPALNDNHMHEDEFIEVHSLQLSGFRTKATFEVTPASVQTSSQTDDRLYDVNGHDGSGDYTVSFATPVKVFNDHKNVRLLSADDSFIMLPQTFAPDSEAKIIMSYTFTGEPTMRQISLPLSSQKWEPGKSYTYKFTIDRSGLLFGTTTITDWEVLDAGNADAH